MKRTPVIMLALCLTAYTANAQPTVTITESRTGDRVTETLTAHGFDFISGFNLSFLYEPKWATFVSGRYDDARFPTVYTPTPLVPSATGGLSLWASVPSPFTASVPGPDFNIGTFVFDLRPQGGCAVGFQWYPAAGASTVNGPDIHVLVPGVQFTGPCEGDFNHDGARTTEDIFGFLAQWFSRSCSVQSLFDFLSSWFGGC